ncbi:AraC family transcriptional regulator [Paenibacillus glycanilyticus]|uniref:AraC family transcriptional regulator n=1 Tax=Paenibacillus glycanilyticus TaxID=126569 RepID=UPI0020424A50|nr:AraC family transcriptional regulator [Paenibacillus glycanilyticus]MCM3626814.1 AraC family transcriptional regulator [Paenibacillus glycanilyticus]
MPLQEQLPPWNDMAVKVLEVQRESLLPGSDFRHYAMPANMLFFARSGHGRLLIDGTSHTITPFFICHAGRDAAVNLVADTEPIEYIAIYYRAELMPSSGRELPSHHDLQIAFGFSPSKRLSLHQVMEQIEHKWSMSNGMEGFHANALLQSLLYELLKQQLAVGYQTPSEAVSIVTKHIDAHYNKPLRLDSLAELVHCSSRQLQRWFNQRLQLGPMEYVIKVRMNHAVRLLQHTEATMQEIAQSTGYRDLYYFSRAFKIYYGRAPLDFRRAYHSDEVFAYPASHSIDNAIVIKHVKGELRLPAPPKRIAVLDVQYADQLFALNEFPAGSVGIGGAELSCFPDYLQNKLGQFTVLGTCEKVNMDAIAALQPDLIICTDLHEKLYSKLSQLAPALMFGRNEDWRKILAIFGALMGKRQKADQVLLEYREKTARLSDKLAEKLRGQHVALIRPRDTSIRLHTATHRTGAVLYEDLGLPAPFYITGDSVSDTAYHISLEDLPEVNASHYFLLSNDMFKEQVTDMQKSVEWNSLNAVKRQCVYTVDASTWIGSYGPTGINRIVDEVARSLLGA